MKAQPPRAARIVTARLAAAMAFLLVLPFGIKDCRSDRGDTAGGSGTSGDNAVSTPQLKAEVATLRKQNTQLNSELDKLVPKDPFIVINTTLNRLEMRQGNQVLVNAVVSTGSNTALVEPNGKRRWFFSTPKGVHSVKKKMIAPTWVKPDWAFVEEGEPIPGAQAEARFEEGTLGKYGLYFGGGYLIHGTLFQRFLGQSVTHGCVRVGDNDLEKIYQNAKVGTKIYIY
jgi:lipoprotein-anchoring transpeptidase ErfK/SrfK